MCKNLSAEYPTSLLFSFFQCIPSAVVSFAIARNKINVVSIFYYQLSPPTRPWWLK